MNVVGLYLDFISPYTYLVLVQAEAFALEHNVEWQLRPVVYGALLDHTGLIGPVETDAKRRYTFQDISRAAQLLAVPLVGPPAHPFRSLDALRVLLAHADTAVALPLARALAEAAWAHGKDLTQPTVLARVVADVGASSTPVEELIKDPNVKLALRASTEEAIARGVFGVPTFEYQDELFWGHDRLPHLAARLRGELAPAIDRATSMAARPRGIDRAGSPARGKD